MIFKKNKNKNEIKTRNEITTYTSGGIEFDANSFRRDLDVMQAFARHYQKTDEKIVYDELTGITLYF